MQAMLKQLEHEVKETSDNASEINIGKTQTMAQRRNPTQMKLMTTNLRETTLTVNVNPYLLQCQEYLIKMRQKMMTKQQ